MRQLPQFSLANLFGAMTAIAPICAVIGGFVSGNDTAVKGTLFALPFVLMLVCIVAASYFTLPEGERRTSSTAAFLEGILFVVVLMTKIAVACAIIFAAFLVISAAYYALDMKRF